MHEHNITNQVVHEIIHACEDNGITHPKKITVEVGQLTGYKKEPINLYFESFQKEYPLLKDTKLEIIEIPGKVICSDCKMPSFPDPSPLILCRACNSSNVKIIEGKEIKITKIQEWNKE